MSGQTVTMALTDLLRPLFCRLTGGHHWGIDWDTIDAHRHPCVRCGAEP